MITVSEAIRQARAYYCLECGKCTGCCPISRVNQSYSPRALLIRALQHPQNGSSGDEALWNCLTCKMCEERCPSNVDYIGLTRDLRAIAYGTGEEGMCTHGGAIQSLMRIMTSPALKQNRMDWITNDLQIAEKGETLYFVGCSPYFDVFFSDLGVKTLDAAKGVIKVLNYFEIRPVLLSNERCCGHDLLWSGDLENFKRLAQHNIEEIKKSGAKRIIFSCPECYRTFKEDYPLYFGKLDFELFHISEFLFQKISSEELTFNSFEAEVTYQDPCRLGRHLGVYDEPREVIKAIPGLQLREMPKSRNTSVCCGASTWMNCTSYSKLIQINRLKEARSTGADLLITACPKCEVHLRCAMRDEKLGNEIRMEIRDLAALAADHLG